MGLWQDGGAGVSRNAIHEIDPGVAIVTLPRSGCLATFGELNAVGDFVANLDAMNTMPRPFMYPFLQQIRQESYNRLSGLLGNVPDVSFVGAITPYRGGDGGAALETKLIENFSRPLGSNHYLGLLARNACHFAPFAWHRWRQAHTAARELAFQASQEHSTSLAGAAWIAEGLRRPLPPGLLRGRAPAQQDAGHAMVHRLGGRCLPDQGERLGGRASGDRSEPAATHGSPVV